MKNVNMTMEDKSKLNLELVKNVKEGNVWACIDVIDRGADVNDKDKSGTTPLHHAACNGYTDVCVALLERGAKINSKNRVGRTPLYYTVTNGYFINCVILIEHGADVNVKDKFKQTPLHYGSQNGRLNTCLLLLNLGVDIEARDIHKQTPLHYAACYRNSDVCLALIDRGADIEAKDEFGKTPLYCAALNCYDDTCMGLIANNASAITINSISRTLQNTLKMTPLEAATSLGKQELILKVISSDVDKETLNQRIQKCIEEAVRNNNQATEALLQSWLTKDEALRAINVINGTQTSPNITKHHQNNCQPKS